MTKVRILVLCTANSCRSQIAHGYLDYFCGDKVEVYSAGLNPAGVHPHAIETMKEDGVDISNHSSNSIDDYTHLEFDYVITVCDHARDNCPYVAARVKNLHHDFPDPSGASGTIAQVRKEFRDTRNQIKDYVRRFAAEYLHLPVTDRG